ncbi:MAG: SdpI family protein [Ruminococcus sp.]|nr:SdpI family protein [Ruminococcus sp.]MDE7099348.1 SdpI family protein [Ruminococcus sp.]
MIFFWFMLVCDLLVPIIMITTGGIMWKHYPKDINGLIGYRTERSRKNMDTWKFAHEYCGKLWLKTGIIILIISALAHIPFIHSSENTISIMSIILCMTQCAVIISTIFPTENALKKTFDDNGNRR